MNEMGKIALEKEHRDFLKKLPPILQADIREGDAPVSNVVDNGIWALTVKFIREELDHGQFFAVRGLCEHLGIINTEERKIVSRAISYLGSKNEVIKGDRLGTWRKGDAKLKPIALFPENEDESFRDFRLPLLQDYIKVDRGDVLLFAGFTSTGKTCIALNFIRENQHLFAGIDYLSNQVGQVKKRLLAFKEHDGLTEKDWGFELFDRKENFAPIINPEHLTVVDFLDALDGDYSKMGSNISQIHNRVENEQGIALVFIQKPPGRDSGFGGHQTHSFVNFSAALDESRKEGSEQKRMKIIKSKLTPEHEEKVMIYKIINKGTKLISLSPLEYPSRLAAVPSFKKEEWNFEE